jgi:hypothetical protein
MIKNHVRKKEELLIIILMKSLKTKAFSVKFCLNLLNLMVYFIHNYSPIHLHCLQHEELQFFAGIQI